MNQNFAFSLEIRPRSFSARLPRQGVLTIGKRWQRSHRARRALVLLAAVSVPAFAAPGKWNSFDIGSAGHTVAVVEPMPYERQGDSFPGSAFYYLAPEGTVPLQIDGLHGDADNAPTGIDPQSGPFARALRIDNSGADRSRAVDCLTAAIYYEAASESDQGQRAVAQVILNRVAHPSFPNTVCGVVYQGSERRTGCQFSFTCDGSLARVPSRFFWQRAMMTAQTALSGYVERSVGLATHYHTIAVHPAWDAEMNRITTIGAHMFFRWRSRAGDASAFRFAYYGNEPVAAPHTRNTAADTVSDPSLDPLALARAYEAGLKSVESASNPDVSYSADRVQVGPAPANASPRYSREVQSRGGDAQYRGEKLPQGDAVRAEFRDSGRWIGAPGT